MATRGELTQSELAFLKEAERWWGETDAALARWAFLNDLNPAERKLASGLRARLRGPKKETAKKPATQERKEDLGAYKLLVAPALIYGLSEKAAPLRRSERVGWLGILSSGSLAGMDFSFKRHFLKSAGLVALEIVFSINFLSVICSTSALFFDGPLKWSLYAMWVGGMILATTSETKLKRKMRRTPSRVILSLVFPWSAQLREMKRAFEAAFAQALGTSLEEAQGVWIGASVGRPEGSDRSEWSRAWERLAVARAMGSLIHEAGWKAEGKSPPNPAEMESMARDQALAMAQCDSLERELSQELPAAAPSRSRSL